MLLCLSDGYGSGRVRKARQLLQVTTNTVPLSAALSTVPVRVWVFVCGLPGFWVAVAVRAALSTVGGLAFALRFGGHAVLVHLIYQAH